MTGGITHSDTQTVHFGTFGIPQLIFFFWPSIAFGASSFADLLSEFLGTSYCVTCPRQIPVLATDKLSEFKLENDSKQFNFTLKAALGFLRFRAKGELFASSCSVAQVDLFQ